MIEFIHICFQNGQKYILIIRTNINNLLIFVGDKRFKCDECAARYSLKFNLNRHKRRTHNQDPKGKHTRCATCGLWFEVTETFRVHTYSHHPPEFRQVITEDDLKCPQCQEVFINWPDHVAHSSTHGLRALPTIQTITEEPHIQHVPIEIILSAPNTRHSKKPHKCELCYKSFSTEERLKVNCTFLLMFSENWHFRCKISRVIPISIPIH